MDECRECGADLPGEANFCSSCGAPQNETAARALYRHTRRHAEELARERVAAGEGGRTDEGEPDGKLPTRLGYALGWVFVVAGLAVVPDPASGFLVFGGVVALPPVRRLLGRGLEQPPEMLQMLVISLTSAAIGVGLFVFG